MGLRDFEYIEPRTVKEACAVLTEHPEEARIYAGGTSLLLLMKQGIVRPTYLVNIKKISNLRYIRNDSPTLKIGSLTTHHDLEISPVIKRYFPVVSEAEREIANIRVRSTGTVGGNLGFAEPLTDLPPIFIALDASVRIEGPQAERTIPLEELFAGYYETTMQPGELLTEILIHRRRPIPDSSTFGFPPARINRLSAAPSASRWMRAAAPAARRASCSAASPRPRCACARRRQY